MYKYHILEYYYQLYLKKIPISKNKLNELTNAGFDVGVVKIKTPRQPKKAKDKKYNIKPKRDYTVKTAKEINIDENIEIIAPKEIVDATNSDTQITNKDEYVIVHKTGKILESDWRPESVIYHKKEFYDWIDSINSGWLNRINYEPFNLYCQQSDDWLAKNEFISDYETYEEQQQFVIDEAYRCRANKLYACCKYGWLSDPSETTGRRKYVAGDDYTHHKILLFLFDCGYSVMLGKPRQIGSSSIIGMAAMFEMILKKNHFIKFIAEDKNTGDEIFNDKILYPYGQLDGWWKPIKPLNDRDGLFKISQSKGSNKSKQANKRDASSKIEMVAPSKTAINGGSPQRSLIDEIGSIPILGDMINEARPTMFVKDKATGKLMQRRSTWTWGTGTTAKGGAAFEKEWNRIMGLWSAREPQVGMIPLFFDWHTRCDEKHYHEEKKYYYGARAESENMDIETSKIQFHQHYPSTPSDMFVQTGKTLLSREAIDKHLERITKGIERTNHKIKYGYFEPEYDFNCKVENQDIPFKIIGAKFVESGYGDEKFSAIIFEEPDKLWIDRYTAGTDPISSDTGSSKMATAIWDELRHTCSCLVNVREPNNPSYSFLQCLLVTIYYDTKNKIGIPELVERNIGLAYRNYRENKGFVNSLILNSELDAYFQSGKSFDVGIDNHSHRGVAIVSRMGEMFRQFGDNLYIQTFFQQLITFVCTTTRGKNETWGSIDKRFYMDDALYALVYAYLAAVSLKKIPKKLDEAETNNMTVQYVLDYDSYNRPIHRPIIKRTTNNVPEKQ